MSLVLLIITRLKGFCQGIVLRTINEPYTAEIVYNLRLKNEITGNQTR